MKVLEMQSLYVMKALRKLKRQRCAEMSILMYTFV